MRHAPKDKWVKFLDTLSGTVREQENSILELLLCICHVIPYHVRSMTPFKREDVIALFDAFSMRPQEHVHQTTNKHKKKPKKKHKKETSPP